MKRSVTVSGTLDADEAWQRYVVVSRWASWAPPIRSVDASSAHLVPGMTGVVHGLLGLRIPFVVDAVDEPGRSWRWTVRAGPLRLKLEHGVVPSPDGGCTATLSVEGPAVAALLYPDLARVALHRLVN